VLSTQENCLQKLPKKRLVPLISLETRKILELGSDLLTEAEQQSLVSKMDCLPSLCVPGFKFHGHIRRFHSQSGSSPSMPPLFSA
jgi:hypothetical protein